MSRLSVLIHKHNIKLGPIVQYLVKLVEQLIGGGNGEVKKKLVADLIAAITRRAAEAGAKVPDNTSQLVDELTEQAVSIYNETGWGIENNSAVAKPATVQTIAVAPEQPKRRGRKPGSKNKPAVTPATRPINTEPLQTEDIDLGDVRFDDED